LLLTELFNLPLPSQHTYTQFWVNDLNVGSNLKSNSNHIKSSCDFIAFNHDSTSVGSIAVLPIDSCGRFTSFPQVAGHSGFVTDFDFSRFHDSLLVTGSEDCNVKLWQIPEGGISGALSSPAATFGPFEARIESLLFHPAADNVIGVSAGNTVRIWDVEHQAEKYVLGGHEDTVQSFSWHGDGSLLATICRDNKEKKLRVFDPRAGSCTGVSSRQLCCQRNSTLCCVCVRYRKLKGTVDRKTPVFSGWETATMCSQLGIAL